MAEELLERPTDIDRTEPETGGEGWGGGGGAGRGTKNKWIVKKKPSSVNSSAPVPLGTNY
jgi:hypothetical protein